MQGGSREGVEWGRREGVEREWSGDAGREWSGLKNLSISFILLSSGSLPHLFTPFLGFSS